MLKEEVERRMGSGTLSYGGMAPLGYIICRVPRVPNYARLMGPVCLISQDQHEKPVRSFTICKSYSSCAID